MWTSNTLMKIETRTRVSSFSPSGPAISRGTGTRSIIVTSPSAGEMICPSACGVTRIGSRKKAATQMVTPISRKPSSSQMANRNSIVTAAEIRTYLRPSGCTAGQRHLTGGLPVGGFSSEGMGGL